MKESTIVKLGVGVLAVVLVSGCITGSGVSDEECVAGVMETAVGPHSSVLPIQRP